MSVEVEKRAAARAAAALVEDGMRVGLGTGSTVRYLLPALVERQLTLRCVATSVATEVLGGELGLEIEPFDSLDALDIAIDGADQVDPDGWTIKGGGGAHTREKIVARASARFVVIISADKVVDALRPPVPLELLHFGMPATLRALGAAQVRPTLPRRRRHRRLRGTVRRPIGAGGASGRDPGRHRARALPRGDGQRRARRARRRRRAPAHRVTARRTARGQMLRGGDCPLSGHPVP
jgi:ribose 5-phosphate isomerase A